MFFFLCLYFLDYLFPNALGCSYLAQLYTFFDKLDLYTNHKEFLANLNELNLMLEKYGDNQNTTFTVFRDDLSARHVKKLDSSFKFFRSYIKIIFI